MTTSNLVVQQIFVHCVKIRLQYGIDRFTPNLVLFMLYITYTVVSITVEVEAFIAVTFVHEVMEVEAGLFTWISILTPACKK